MLNRSLVEKLFSANHAEAEDAQSFAASFVEDEKFDHFNDEAPFRVVIGNKGTGKSAFLRRYAAKRENDNGIILIKLDPADMINKLIQVEEDPLKAINQWREFFAMEAATAVLSGNVASLFGKKPGNLFTATNSFLSWVRKHANTVTFGAANIVMEHGRKLDDLRQVIFVIDDLDQGWDGRIAGAYFVSSMMRAAFDVTRKDPSIKFRLSLRWDIFDRVIKVNPDTDKMRPNFTHLTWTPHEVYVLVAKRISAGLGREFDADHVIRSNVSQVNVEAFYDDVVSRRFQGRGAWANTPMRRVLLSMCRRRPRDLLSLLYQAGMNATSSGKQIIDPASLENVFSRFSEERISDITIEYKGRMPELETLLFGFKPPRKRRSSSGIYRFTNDQLILRIKNILAEHTEIKFTHYGHQPSPQDVIEFLYRIEFLQAYFMEGPKTRRADFDQHQRVFLNKNDVGFSWEILPVYRWALTPTQPTLPYETLLAMDD